MDRAKKRVRRHLRRGSRGLEGDLALGDVRQNEHLIIQTAFVGDLLLSIPLLKELRRLKPADRLVLLCRKGLGSFFVQTGLVDETLEFEKSAGTASASWSAVKSALRAREFDLVICPHESPRTRLLVRSLRAKLKIGYAGFLNFLVFNVRIERPMDLPEALRQLALLEPLASVWGSRLQEFRKAQQLAGGIAQSSFANGKGPELHVRLTPVPTWASMELDALSSLGRAFRSRAPSDGVLRLRECGAGDRLLSLLNEINLNNEQLIAVLAPGSVWATKMWTHIGYCETARALLRDGFRVLLTGAPNEAEICDSIANEVPGVTSIAGRTGLFESAQILSCADVLICNDSGAMHMAASAGVPTVSIFGPTVLKFGYRPWQNHASVESVELPCRPCGKHGAMTCPIGTHDCMKKVSPERVLRAAHALLEPEKLK